MASLWPESVMDRSHSTARLNKSTIMINTGVRRIISLTYWPLQSWETLWTCEGYTTIFFPTNEHKNKSLLPRWPDPPHISSLRRDKSDRPECFYQYKSLINRHCVIHALGEFWVFISSAQQTVVHPPTWTFQLLSISAFKHRREKKNQ